jgi:hypothetical protein
MLLLNDELQLARSAHFRMRVQIDVSKITGEK